MSNVNATASATATASTQDKTGKAVSSAVDKTLNQEDFLHLLTTELSNQNPLEPMDNKDFIAQLAQFSTLEQMNNTAATLQNLNTNMISFFQQSLLTQGAALIGKQVSGMDAKGGTVSGIVDSVQWLDGNPQLKLLQGDGTFKTLEMNQITDVTEPVSNKSPNTPTLY